MTRPTELSDEALVEAFAESSERLAEADARFAALKPWDCDAYQLARGAALTALNRHLPLGIEVQRRGLDLRSISALASHPGGNVGESRSVSCPAVTDGGSEGERATVPGLRSGDTTTLDPVEHRSRVTPDARRSPR